MKDNQTCLNNNRNNLPCFVPTASGEQPFQPLNASPSLFLPFSHLSFLRYSCIDGGQESMQGMELSLTKGAEEVQVWVGANHLGLQVRSGFYKCADLYCNHHPQ